jgi:hypothetical protein
MTTAPDYQTDYNTTQARNDAMPGAVTNSAPPQEPERFMTMFELDGKWAIRVQGVTAFLKEKHLLANMPAQGIIQEVMSAVNNAYDHANGTRPALNSAVLDTNGLPRDLNVPKTDGSTMDQGLRTADNKSIGADLAASGAFGQSGAQVTKNPVEPSTNPTAEFARTGSEITGVSSATGNQPLNTVGTYGNASTPKSTYDAVAVEQMKDDGKSPAPNVKPTTLPPKDEKKKY